MKGEPTVPWTYKVYVKLGVQEDGKPSQSAWKEYHYRTCPCPGCTFARQQYREKGKA